MADANGINLDRFALVVQPSRYAGFRCLGPSEDGAFELTIKQTIPATPDMADKQPMMIPVKTGLLNEKGEAVEFGYQGKRVKEAVLVLTEAEQTFVLGGVNEPVIPSLLRDFSAPITLNSIRTASKNWPLTGGR